MSTTPTWIARYTTTSGAPDPRKAGREARPRTCPRCARLVLHGADHHRIAAYVTVDPYALTPTDEAKAVINGTATYELAGEPPKWELRPRAIPGVPLLAPLRPASEIRVVAAHNCDRHPLSTHALPVRPPPPADHGGEPPF